MFCSSEGFGVLVWEKTFKRALLLTLKYKGGSATDNCDDLKTYSCFIPAVQMYVINTSFPHYYNLVKALLEVNHFTMFKLSAIDIREIAFFTGGGRPEIFVDPFLAHKALGWTFLRYQHFGGYLTT